jgi:SAM-dependent methyltransferase
MHTDPRPLEVEPPGITYDRLRMDRLLTHWVRTHAVRTALELPADGSKAMPSIYSLALARAGVHVTLVNPEPQGIEVWQRLGLADRLTVHRCDDIAHTGLPQASFDLVWNFVSLGVRHDLPAGLREMARLSRHSVLTVHMNGFNWGYPWHRFLHAAFRLPWTHGEPDHFFPRSIRARWREAGLEPQEEGLLDMPWWPDPPGFRDVRLHLAGRDDVAVADWRAPIEDIYAGQPVPAPLAFLERLEDAPVPRPIRRVFSHLFYIAGRPLLGPAAL